ncbi:hypothetical protein SAY86_022741 [Trapa natans]|uniref:Myb-like domain-containing protein n=1 Tax=Trapa natans TaxID=22666 RepID=A0AAN7M993_TRANT|nr:hypothetical protein SAY86_022741 [Trapa natans]
MADLEVDHSSEDSSMDSTVSNCSGQYWEAEDEIHSSKLEFSEDEETLISRMYKLVGERWALIAGRIPGRSAEEIHMFWTSRYSSSES